MNTCHYCGMKFNGSPINHLKKYNCKKSHVREQVYKQQQQLDVDTINRFSFSLAREQKRILEEKQQFEKEKRQFEKEKRQFEKEKQQFEKEKAECIEIAKRCSDVNARRTKGMKLYKVTPGVTAEQGYDSWDSMICYAQSELGARYIFPRDGDMGSCYSEWWKNESYLRMWDHPDNLNVKEVSMACATNKVVCASYNAG